MLKTKGIVIPTICEAELLLEGVSDRKEFIVQGKRFFTGYLNTVRVALSICGPGKVNAAHGATLLFERFNPAHVYALGTAGAYPSSGLDIGDVAMADREIYGDEGLQTVSGIVTMEALGLPLVSSGSGDHYNEFPLLVPGKLKGHKHMGAFVTVSACTGLLKKGLEISRRFNAICENMEGAAIAHIGLLNNIPVTEIRGVGNIIEDRDGKPLDRAALTLAAENAQRFFIDALGQD